MYCTYNVSHIPAAAATTENSPKTRDKQKKEKKKIHSNQEKLPLTKMSHNEGKGPPSLPSVPK